MTDIPITSSIESLLQLQKKGDSATLLGIGPMSQNLLQASFELARDNDFPLMFIASRNQVDMEELGGGYVNNWNQTTFVEAIKNMADKTGFKGLYYICRDHGGPWQRDEERDNHLPEEEAMEIGKKSFLADIESGFDLLMVDPTKDPFERGKVIPLEKVIDRTVYLIEYCESERKKRGLPEVGYEVGTEETNGGLTSTEIYEEFILELKNKLTNKGLPIPTFIVGQTGTLVRKTEQAGEFNFKNAFDLAQMAKKYNVALKEHNGDYLDDVTLLKHVPAQITATNVAPQYGTEETRAYLKLVKLEEELKEQGLIDEPSNLKKELLEKSIKSERWRKWMTDDQLNLSVEDIYKDSALSNEILDIAGHYTFNNLEVAKEIDTLYKNLEKVNIDGKKFVVDCIKRPIRDYVEAYNLKGVTTRIKRNLNM